MTKDQIRSLQKETRDQLSAEEQQKLSESVMTKLLNTDAYHSCSCLLSYVSFRSEVITHEIIQAALTAGKKVYIPRVEPPGMEFYQINHLEGLTLSNYGVLEPPSEDGRRFYPEACTEACSGPCSNLMLLPGLAFDPAGNRIGYGAGYYDKYLSSHDINTYYKIALAYDFQVIEKIQVQEFDIKADMIITPTRIIQIEQ